jgi:hypothetical protein
MPGFLFLERSYPGLLGLERGTAAELLKALPRRFYLKPGGAAAGLLVWNWRTTSRGSPFIQ